MFFFGSLINFQLILAPFQPSHRTIIERVILHGYIIIYYRINLKLTMLVF